MINLNNMVVEELKEKAIEKATKRLKEEFVKVAKRLGWNFFISELPEIGNFWPAFTIFTWQETKKNLTAPDGILILPLALIFDIIMMVIGFFDWGDFGMIGMTIRFFGWVFFYGWKWIRGGGLTGGVESDENEEGNEENEGEPASAESSGMAREETKKESPSTKTQQKNLKTPKALSGKK